MDWSVDDWIKLLVALGGFAGIVTPLAIQVIRAVRENTRVTVANTLDRAEKTVATNEKLDTIVGAVTGTGSGVTVVNVPPAAPPAPDAP